MARTPPDNDVELTAEEENLALTAARAAKRQKKIAEDDLMKEVAEEAKKNTIAELEGEVDAYEKVCAS